MKNNRPDQYNKTFRTIVIQVLAAAFMLPLHGCNENVPVAEPFDAAPVAVTRAPVEELDETEKEAVILGGRLYDDWPTLKGKTFTANNPMAVFMPDYPSTAAGSVYGDFVALDGGLAAPTKPNQYRCVTCHGFDYLGSKFSDVGIMDAANNKAVEEIQAIIRDGISFKIGTTTTTVHKFGGDLSGADIKALAIFIKYGVVDIGDYIYAFGPVGKGNAGNGLARYTGDAGCARSTCHGSTGQAIDFDPEPAVVSGDQHVEYVGTIGQNDPDEMLHKIRFGQPGSVMPSIYEKSGLTTQDAADIMTYTQQLPAQ